MIRSLLSRYAKDVNALSSRFRNYQRSSALLSSPPSHTVDIGDTAPAAAASFSIRYAGVEDIPSISLVNLENLPENYPESFFETHLRRWPHLGLVAVNSDTQDVVAYALGRVEEEKEVVVGVGQGREQEQEQQPLTNVRKNLSSQNYYHHYQMISPRLVKAPAAVGHITSIAVDRTYRGKGLGVALMRLMHASLAREYAVEHVTLHVRAGNTEAINLYCGKLAYRSLREEGNYYADGEAALAMKCSLVLVQGT